MARIRITIDTEESHKRAFLAHASIEGLSPQQLFQRMVEEYCAADLERARQSISEDDEEEKKPKPRRKS